MRSINLRRTRAALSFALWLLIGWTIGTAAGTAAWPGNISASDISDSIVRHLLARPVAARQMARLPIPVTSPPDGP